MSSAIEFAKGRPDRSTKVVLAYDPEDALEWRKLAQAVRVAEQQLHQARETAKLLEESVPAADAVEKAEAAVEEAKVAEAAFKDSLTTITFHLRAIGGEAVEALIDKYPASNEEKDRHTKAVKAEGGTNQFLRYSPARFPPALLAACCTKLEAGGEVDNGLSVVDAEYLWSKGPLDEVDKQTLFNECLRLDQRGSRVDDLGKDFATILGLGS